MSAHSNTQEKNQEVKNDSSENEISLFAIGANIKTKEKYVTKFVAGIFIPGISCDPYRNKEITKDVVIKSFENNVLTYFKSEHDAELFGRGKFIKDKFLSKRTTVSSPCLFEIKVKPLLKNDGNFIVTQIVTGSLINTSPIMGPVFDLTSIDILKKDCVVDKDNFKGDISEITCSSSVYSFHS